MKISKRVFSVSFVVALLLSTLTITSYAVKPSDFVVESGVLTEYLGKDENVIIPDNLGITKIGYGAFMNKTSMKLVSIPEGVTEIGGWAFHSANNLNSVELPSTLKVIGDSAFERCSNLVSIELPQSVTFVGYGAFFGCRSLSSFAIPDGVTTIGSCTFAKCPNLTYLLIPNSVTFISPALFREHIDEGVVIENSPDTNPNVTVYVEKGSIAESVMKKLNKTTVALDTIEKSSKDRIPVTLKELTVIVDNKPMKFNTFHINGSNYFNLFEITNALRKVNKSYYIFFLPGQKTDLALSYKEEKPDDYWFYNVSNLIPNQSVNTTVSAVPQIISCGIGEYKTAYIIGNGIYMQIRDIGKTLGFSVSWNNKNKMISIDTSNMK